MWLNGGENVRVCSQKGVKTWHWSWVILVKLAVSSQNTNGMCNLSVLVELLFKTLNKLNEIQNLPSSKPQMPIGHGQAFFKYMVIHHNLSDKSLASFRVQGSCLLHKLTHIYRKALFAW